MLLPRKLCAPILTRDTRNDVLEKSALMIDSPSATIVPVPTALRYGFSCPTSVPKFDPVCSTGSEVVPEPAQVVDDVGAVAEELDEERRLVRRRDRPVEPVVEAVQRVDPVRA